MATAFEDLRILHVAEAIADDIWQHVVGWEEFARDVVGKQLARATDSIGANIAEAYGRFHFGEKIQFLYYSRGSLFETKYWLNRALARNLMPLSDVQGYADRLSNLARQLNAFAGSLKSQRYGNRKQSKAMREAGADYATNMPNDAPEALFSETDLEWLRSLPAETDRANL
jgi:four helix bundle protein